MNVEDIKDKWNNRYQVSAPELVAAEVLNDHLHLLPMSGKALDLACGLGANARVLARHGLETHAWDLSSVATEQLQQYAESKGLNLHVMTRDVIERPPQQNSFNVIVVSSFLDRSLCPALMDALVPGGLLFYQTYSKTKVNEAGPANAEFLLDDNELLELFAPLEKVFYREEARVGNVMKGFRNQAQLIAQKP
ncbi:MAG: methyltransferase domain-containing protein [Gammaproteobacteria bacterium]|nr:MAG: methyltransferase domain-containing protein [Gammaproteobacteria bacterium]